MEDIKVPIKDLLANATLKHQNNYPENEFNLLRRYFISCLNMGYIMPAELPTMVDKFCGLVKNITLNLTSKNGLDCYLYNEGNLSLIGNLKFVDEQLYDLSFFKAVSDIFITNAGKVPIIGKIISQLVATRIYIMDIELSRNVKLNKKNIQIADKTHVVTTETNEYELQIVLLEQFILAKNISVHAFIRNFYYKDYEYINKIIDSNEKDRLVMQVLKQIDILETLRKLGNKEKEATENILIDKYQLLIGSLFETKGQNYLEFLSIVTTDDLRKKCISVSKEGQSE